MTAFARAIPVALLSSLLLAACATSPPQAEAPAPLTHRHLARDVLSRKLAAHAHAEDQPAAAETIEGRHLLRDEHRVPKRQEIYCRSQREPLREGGQLRKLEKRVEDRHRERDMIANPERVELESLRLLDDRPRHGHTVGLGDDTEAEMRLERQLVWCHLRSPIISIAASWPRATFRSSRRTREWCLSSLHAATSFR